MFYQVKHQAHTERSRDITDLFQLPTRRLARALLGTTLVHDSPEGRTSGVIVETEAYLFRGDPACHAHKGMTKRNASMFGPPGMAYVYLIYGMYYCFNVVGSRPGVGEAVLIRAIEPREGLELMHHRRRVTEQTQLASGPGKLVMAMGIGPEHDGIPLFGKSSLRIEPRRSRPSRIASTTRIGITKGMDLPLRFYIAGSRYVSKK